MHFNSVLSFNYKKYFKIISSASIIYVNTYICTNMRMYYVFTYVCMYMVGRTVKAWTTMWNWWTGLLDEGHSHDVKQALELDDVVRWFSCNSRDKVFVYFVWCWFAVRTNDLFGLTFWIKVVCWLHAGFII